MQLFERRKCAEPRCDRLFMPKSTRHRYCHRTPANKTARPDARRPLRPGSSAVARPGGVAGTGGSCGLRSLRRADRCSRALGSRPCPRWRPALLLGPGARSLQQGSERWPAGVAHLVIGTGATPLRSMAHERKMRLSRSSRLLWRFCGAGAGASDRACTSRCWMIARLALSRSLSV